MGPGKVDLKGRDLICLHDFTPGEIAAILELAGNLKEKQKKNIPHAFLQGKTLGMIFYKSSTRTRVSFEVGMFQLGGHALFLSTNDIQMGRGESIKDTARVLSRYCVGIMIRTYGQFEVETLARYSTVPVINGLTDFSHPCQVLADLMTIRERMSRLEGLKLCFIGDGNNMANSLIVGGLKCNMNVSVATPPAFRPDEQILEFAKNHKGSDFLLTDDIQEAARGADVLITDVWASMGQEEEAAKRKLAFSGYRIDNALLRIAHENAIVLHCLPAHKGEEITEDVFEAQADVIFEEAENRLHAQKAVMSILMK